MSPGCTWRESTAMPRTNCSALPALTLVPAQTSSPNKLTRSPNLKPDCVGRSSMTFVSQLRAISQPQGGRLVAGWRNLLALQGKGHDFLEDRPTKGSAVVTIHRVLQCHRDNERRIVGGRKADKRGGEAAITATLRRRPFQRCQSFRPPDSRGSGPSARSPGLIPPSPSWRAASLPCVR